MRSGVEPTQPFARPRPTLPFEAALFDLDGTLLDSVELILASYRHALAHHGLPPQPDEVVLAGLGIPLEAQFRRWVDAPALVDALIDTYRAHNFAMHDAMARAYPGVADVVRELRALGTKLAVVTSKRREGTRRGLALLGLEAEFDVLVCSDDVRRAKPDPEPVLRALADLGGVAPERAAFVGDSTHDMLAGRAAGVHTVAVLWGPFAREQLEPTEPRRFVETASELRAALLGV
jgi:pyrophosphatase PpaX